MHFFFFKLLTTWIVGWFRLYGLKILLAQTRTNPSLKEFYNSTQPNPTHHLWEISIRCQFRFVWVGLVGWIHHPKPRTPEWLSKKLVPIICFVRDQFSTLLSLPYHTYHNYTYAKEVAQTSLHYWLKTKIKHNKISCV